MVSKAITIETFYNAYSQSLGIEGAQKLIKDVIIEADLDLKDEYIRDEALQICDFLKKKSGFIKIISITLSSRIRVVQAINKP